MVSDRHGREGRSRKPQQSFEVSDAPIVPTCEKSANAEVTPAESMEGRGAAKGSSVARDAPSTQGETSADTKMQRTRQGVPCVVGRRSMQTSKRVHRRSGWLRQLERRSIRRSTPYALDPRWEPGAGNPLAGFCPGGGLGM